MSTIYDYILQNFTDEIVLDDIARQAHISPSGFCRYFKARTKRTLKEFVNDLRVNYACQLLEENQHNITKICFKAGFNNISNFNRRFKEINGITPQHNKTHKIRTESCRERLCPYVYTTVVASQLTKKNKNKTSF